MKISCCVFDLDGTLLTSKNKISDTDKKTLMRLSSEGVRMVICTGRSDLQIKEYADDLRPCNPILITCNGGQIFEPETNKKIHECLFSAEDVRHMINTLLERNADFLVYSPDYIYHSENSERIKFYLRYNTTVPEKFRVPIRHISELPDDYTQIRKMLTVSAGSNSEFRDIESALNPRGDLVLVKSWSDLIDIMPPKTDKGNAVKILAEYLNIPISEVVAFGDHDNDETMLRAAGFSVAMGNAVDNIKSICDFVTKTNDEYGITYALEHIINDL